MAARFGYFELMAFSMKRLQRNKIARALALVAAVTFIFLLRPYCETANAADADVVSEPSDHRAGGHEHNRPAPGDTCPSLDHTSVVLPDAVSSPPVDAAPQFLIARAWNLDAGATAGKCRIAPRATPPPNEPLPLYLRYAHLLI